MTAIAGAGTVQGVVAGITYEKLIDLQYSVNDSYRSSPSAAWLTRDLTAGSLRKLRDGAGGTEGAPLWQPSVTGGIAGLRQPPFLLGAPLYSDPNVASIASTHKVAAFGDFSAYFFRHVGDVVLERSTDLYFDRDVTAYRATWRVDGKLLDSSAINGLRVL